MAASVPPGAFGENLTVEGVDVSGAVIGERWRIGTVELQVAQPRLPCFKLGLRFGDPKMLKRFAEAGRPGAYLRIVTEGELEGRRRSRRSRDRPEHGVTIAEVARAIMLDETLLARRGGRARAAAESLRAGCSSAPLSGQARANAASAWNGTTTPSSSECSASAASRSRTRASRTAGSSAPSRPASGELAASRRSISAADG